MNHLFPVKRASDFPEAGRLGPVFLTVLLNPFILVDASLAVPCMMSPDGQ